MTSPRLQFRLTLPATGRMMAPEVKFVTDSPLEGGGFELPVPQCARIADSAALVVPLDPAVSGEFHRIAARHLDWSPCSNGITVVDGRVHLIPEKA